MNELNNEVSAPESCDLYISLNKKMQPLHIEKNFDGENGFLRFMAEDVDKLRIHRSSESLLLQHYRIMDPTGLPRIDNYSNPNFWVELSHFLLNSEYYLIQSILVKADSKIDQMKKQPEINFEGVETERGVMLFSTNSVGSELQVNYLQSIADNFYNPALGVETLRIYELETIPAVLADKVNASFTKWPPIQPNVYIAPAVVHRGYCFCEYDMRASYENLLEFSGPESTYMLHVSDRNYDISVLQYLVAEGLNPDDIFTDLDEGLAFSYEPRFENLKKRIEDAKTDEKKLQISEEGRMMAAKILMEDFSDIRQFSPNVPKLLAQGVSRFLDHDGYRELEKMSRKSIPKNRPSKKGLKP